MICPNENSSLRNVQTSLGQSFSYARIVCHACECAGVGPTTTAAASPTIMGGFVRIVETRRSMSNNYCQPCKASREPHVPQYSFDDTNHFVNGVTEMTVFATWRGFGSLDQQSCDGRGLHESSEQSSNPGGQPRKQYTRHERNGCQGTENSR